MPTSITLVYHKTTYHVLGALTLADPPPKLPSVADLVGDGLPLAWLPAPRTGVETVPATEPPITIDAAQLAVIPVDSDSLSLPSLRTQELNLEARSPQLLNPGGQITLILWPPAEKDITVDFQPPLNKASNYFVQIAGADLERPIVRTGKLPLPPAAAPPPTSNQPPARGQPPSPPQAVGQSGLNEFKVALPDVTRKPNGRYKILVLLQGYEPAAIELDS